MTTPLPTLPSARLIWCCLPILLAANACDVTEPPLPIGQPPTDRDAVWSPDGQQLAFEHLQGHDGSGRLDDPEVSGIYVANDDGSGRRLLVPNAGAPAWSPDGRYLLYQTYYELHIYRLELATGTVIQLTSGNNWNRFPAWSPDGRRIAFDSNRGVASGLSYLHLMDPDGTNVRRLTLPADTTGDELYPSFERGGVRLAYAVYVRDSRNERSGTEVFVVDTTGQNVSRLPHGMFPRWSPVDDWIAYIVEDRPQEFSLRLVRSDGTGGRTVYGAGQGAAGIPKSRPGWSPDGAWIVFTGGSGDRQPLWAIRPDGSGLRQVSHMPSN